MQLSDQEVSMICAALSAKIYHIMIPQDIRSTEYTQERYIKACKEAQPYSALRIKLRNQLAR